ncbi:MAG: class 1 fructose-bisphosphatase [Bacteroidia bacterium]|nr:class 1 fructose-bisphosphatase [Bacteroidia bacterium]
MVTDTLKYAPRVGTAIDRFIAQDQINSKHAVGDLSQLLRDIVLASKIINREINKAGLTDIDSSTGVSNPQDEDQKRLDMIAHARFLRAFFKGKKVCALISEEAEDLILTGNNDAKYIVAIDPLDGSSNIDVNVSIGTIFSIYHRKSPIGSEPTVEDFLQKGEDQVAAGYVQYGSSTMLVYTTGRGVYGFTLEPSLGEYFLSHPIIKIPNEGSIYSVNDGYFNKFSPEIQSYIKYCHEQQFKARYIGSLVADFHRNMLKGGIYLYPPTKKHQLGKIRLMYESNALAFIAEQAGGQATDGQQRILQIDPTSIHQRSPLYIGSSKMVDHLTTFW